MPVYCLNKGCSDLEPSPQGFYVSWSIVKDNGTVIARNPKYPKSTWYEVEDKSLHRGSLAHYIREIVRRTNLGVDATYLIELPKIPPTLYLCLSVTAKRFESGLEHKSFDKAFLSHVRSNGVRFFLKWKAGHRPKLEAWIIDIHDHGVYRSQISTCFDAHFYWKVSGSQGCQDAKAVGEVVDAVAIDWLSELQPTA
ncbi:hypothetical protein TMEN_4476 [Trichophyton mentagrophytes]|nr:hypothetical protein TMEN_4476 [Trichophyton mentagrophytes]